MKIGFSFGRCVRDVVLGEVNIDDILVIVTRTRITSLESLEGVIDEYMWRPGYLQGLDQEACMQVAREIWERGLMHQPRVEGKTQFGNAYPAEEVWGDVVPTYKMNEQVKEAWNHYRFIMSLNKQEKLV